MGVILSNFLIVSVAIVPLIPVNEHPLKQSQIWNFLKVQ
jgi:hypothetical protein